GRPLAETMVGIALGVVLPVVSLTLGFAVAFLRPGDTRALLLLLMMLSFAQLPGTDVADEAAWGPGWRVAGTFYDNVMADTWGIWMMLFGIAFPERLELDRRRPWLKWVVIGPLALAAVVQALAGVSAVEGLSAGATLIRLAEVAGPATLVLGMVAI